jgi:hypothetical protein
LENLWIEPDELESLRCRSCRNGRVFWIFTDCAPELVEKMEENGGSIRIGCFVYEFRRGRKFIVRFPVKPDRNRKKGEDGL